MRINENLRGEERVRVALPVRLDSATGLTRDVGASGVFFEVDTSYKPGSEIGFIIEMEAFAEKMLLKCRGSIVRTENCGEKIGVAVRITESVMETAN